MAFCCAIIASLIEIMLDCLEKLGLSRKEAKVYLAALNLGEASPVSTIARKASIHRTSVYDTLEKLRKRGLVVKNKIKAARYYRALSPKKIINYLDEKKRELDQILEDAEDLLPDLEAEYKAMSNRPRVNFYEGEEGLMRVYEETLKAKEEILAYANAAVNHSTINRYLQDYYKRRASKKISLRSISNDSKEDREQHARDKEELRECRLVPKNKIDFTPEINFFDNKIMIANWKEKFGVIIESEEIAKVFKQTFELAWEAAEKYHVGLLEKEPKTI